MYLLFPFLSLYLYSFLTLSVSLFLSLFTLSLIFPNHLHSQISLSMSPSSPLLSFYPVSTITPLSSQFRGVHSQRIPSRCQNFFKGTTEKEKRREFGLGSEWVVDREGEEEGRLELKWSRVLRDALRCHSSSTRDDSRQI